MQTQAGVPKIQIQDGTMIDMTVLQRVTIISHKIPQIEIADALPDQSPIEIEEQGIKRDTEARKSQKQGPTQNQKSMMIEEQGINTQKGTGLSAIELMIWTVEEMRSGQGMKRE